jgi:hypothetical protein
MDVPSMDGINAHLTGVSWVSTDWRADYYKLSSVALDLNCLNQDTSEKKRGH